MNEIKLLSEQTASKIAAGEVIDRPASVLKELLENAIDAGATRINIDIENAGKKLIRVNDNGCGIKESELKLALLRHSTSKIVNFEDLETLNTFGFRGEALFSISAVSKLTISSYQEGSKPSRLYAEGGKIISQSSAPALQGTTAEVRDLFFNTPARLKFLKTDSVERSHLLLVVEETALANLDIAFQVKIDGALIYNFAPVKNEPENLRKRISQIIGKETAETLHFIKEKDFNFCAYISPINKLCASRNLQYFFVNKRPVNCKILQQAIFKAYQPYRASNRYPCAIVYLTLPPSDFDVNIHPQKKEVKFAVENEIFSFVYKKVQQALLEGQEVSSFENKELEIKKESENIINTKSKFAPKQTQDNLFSFSPKKQEQVKEEKSFNPKILQELSTLLKTENDKEKTNKFTIHDFEEQTKFDTNYEESSYIEEKQKIPFVEKTPTWWKGPYIFLGQLKNSYLLFENDEGLVIVDQHAAQERIYFEEFLSLLENNKVDRQPLLFPLDINMSASHIETICNWKKFLQDAGFEIIKKQENLLEVKTSPLLLKMKENQIKDFLLSFAEIAGDPERSDNAFRHKFIATKACKKAVKAGQVLNQTEALTLINNMKNCKDALHCPHGRPTMLVLTMSELARRIGRN